MTNPTRSHRLAAALAAVALAASSSPLRGADERSQNWYTFCAFCHGEDGRAKTEDGKKNGARDLTNAKWQETVSDERLVASVTKGRDKMPAFAKKLTADDIRALVKEVRSLARK